MTGNANAVRSLFTPVASTYRAVNHALTFVLVAVHEAVKNSVESAAP